MKYYLVQYPQEKYRFELYDNTRKLTRQQVQKETGCYALVNLWYFALADQPKAGVKYWDHQNGGVMLKGKWAYEQYDFPGICISKDGRMTTGWKKDAGWDYAAAVQADYIGGNRVHTQAWGRNGVTYTGLKADGTVVVLLASKDDGVDSAEAVQAMRKAGCVDILRWDGSWSSQGYLWPGIDVQPSQRRLVRGYLLIYCRENNEGHEEEDEPMDGADINYLTHNDCYKAGKTIKPTGIMLHSTAMPGVNAENLMRLWDVPGVDLAVHAMVDNQDTLQTLPWNRRGWHAGTGSSGKTANDTHISIEICEPDMCRLLPIEWVPLYRGKKDNPMWAVKRLQMELQARNYDPKGLDGSFGPGCEAALKNCQRALGLAADGSCGPATLDALSKRTGSYLSYNAQETEAYFCAAWNRAVALCANLCKEYGFDPLKDIICHSEGYKAGIASNHADVMHWFPHHGKTMDTFRAAVKVAIGGPPSPNDPFGAAVDKLVAAGIMDSPGSTEYWKGGNYSAATVQALIIKMAAAI